MSDLTMLAYDYLDELRSSDFYIEYMNLNKRIDSQYEKEIKEFNNIKDKYDEVLSIGRFHPGFKEMTLLYRDAKVKFFEIEDIKRYYELVALIENSINETLDILGTNISTNIPVVNKFGFVSGNKGGNCSGNCG